MFIFLYLGRGKVHRHIADHRVESLEGCRHGGMMTHTASQLGAETQPSKSALGWACACVWGVPPSSPLPLPLCWYSQRVCRACSVSTGWARRVAKEQLSHWMFD